MSSKPETTHIRMKQDPNGQYYIHATDLLDWMDTLKGNRFHLQARNYIVGAILAMFYVEFSEESDDRS